jgi:hypothetical protein
MTAPPFFVFIPCDFLPYAPVGSRILGPCVPVLISSLRMYSRSPCALPSVVLICFPLRTGYTVSYITCTVIYLAPQSEYRTRSPPSNLFPLRSPQLAPCSFALGPSPRRPWQVGSASDSETVRKPLAVLLPSSVFPPARNITLLLRVYTLFRNSLVSSCTVLRCWSTIVVSCSHPHFTLFLLVLHHSGIQRGSVVWLGNRDKDTESVRYLTVSTIFIIHTTCWDRRCCSGGLIPPT